MDCRVAGYRSLLAMTMGEPSSRGRETPVAIRTQSSSSASSGPPISNAFLETLWRAENPHEALGEAGRRNALGKRNPNSSAAGLYQIIRSGLIDAGMKDAQGRWTNKARQYGVTSDADFLRSPKAQDAAIRGYLERKEKNLEAMRLFDHVGQEIDGVKGQFKITRAGLVAAAHREGEGTVKEYINLLRRNNWRSDFDHADKSSPKLAIKDEKGNIVRTVKDRFLALETRLRVFSEITYR